jgi:hypothetical protein
LRKKWLEKWAKINYRLVGGGVLLLHYFSNVCSKSVRRPGSFSIHQHIDRRGMGIMQQATKG